MLSYWNGQLHDYTKMHMKLTTKDNIAYINLSIRPINLLNEQVLQSFISHLNTIEQDPSILGAILHSSRKDFCYGADIQYLSQLYQEKNLNHKLKQVHQSLLSIQKPWVALINGKCLGGGLELALLCPYRIGIQNSDLLFSCPEINLGIMPGLGATQRLPRAIGLQASMQLILNQAKFNEIQALDTYLIHELTTYNKAIELAIQYIKKPFSPPKKTFHPNEVAKLEYSYIIALAKSKTQGCYPNVQYCLQAIYEGSYLPLPQALSIEAQYFTKTLKSPHIKSLLSIHIHRQQIRRTYRSTLKPIIGVIGGGFMGSAIAQHTQSLNISTILIEQTSQVKLLQKKHPQLSITDDLKKLSTCTIVIESITENLQLKQSILQKAEQHITSNTLLCSNTSALPITQLSKTLKHPERFLGLHFFSPVDKMPLIEIIHHPNTHPDYIIQAKQLSSLLQKTPIQIEDTPGFYTTNIILHYLLSALTLYTQGINPILIENASKQIGMKTPPFILLDEIGIDIAYHILQSLPNQPNPKILELIQYLYNNKHHGRKTQQGFYLYPKKQFSPKLLNRYPREDLPFNIIKDKLLSTPLQSAITLNKKASISNMDAQLGLLFLGFSPIHISRLE